MNLNSALLKYHIINSLIFVDGDYSVSRELKVKLIRYKFNFKKFFDEFNEIQSKYIEEVKTDEYNKLVSIPIKDRTKKQDDRLDKLIQEINSEYNSLINQKLSEEVNTDWYTPLNETEFDELLTVNIEHNVNINGTEFNGTDFITLIHDNLL
jgi:hypothetical protein